MTQPSGVDLARVALQAAKEAARAKAQQPAKPRRGRTRATYRNGRDPVGLGDAITQLTVDHAWEMPVAGANLVEQWSSIAPELVGRVAAERWDADRRCLHLRPVSPAYATQLRLLGQQLVARINAHAGGPQVASIRVLPPGGDQAVTIPRQAATDAPAAGPVVTPAKTPGGGCAGYQAARAIVLAARQERDDQAAARDRHFAHSRGWLREPEGNFTDAVEMVNDLTAKAEASEDVHRRAVAAARAQRAGGPVPGVVRLADTA